MTNYTEPCWTVPTILRRWHIDDVKKVIKNSSYKDETMPSDEKLTDYLFAVVGNESWIQQMNEQLETQLDGLFREVK